MGHANQQVVYLHNVPYISISKQVAYLHKKGKQLISVIESQANDIALLYRLVHKVSVMHWRKEFFPAKTYNTVKYKNISRCKIIWNRYSNAYEIELSDDMEISPIFNVAYFYPYK